MLSLATRGIQSQTKIYGLGLATRGMVEVGFVSVLDAYGIIGKADLTSGVTGQAALISEVAGRAVLTTGVSGRAILTIGVSGQADLIKTMIGRA